MRDVFRVGLAALALSASVGFVGCSSSSDSGGFGDNGSSSGTNGSSGGSNGSSSGASSQGGDDATTPGGDDASTSDDGGAEPDATTGPRDAGHLDASSHPADSGPTADAGGGTVSDASPDESAWLDPMNQARADVMANEPPLTWNPIAAQVALAYAQQCNYLHNPNLQSDYKSAGGTTSAGENIAAGAPTLTIAGANMGWIDDEKPAYTYATNSCNTSIAPECGHYTQIVWKTTTSVGCALVTCNTNSPFNTAKYGTKWGYAVCDYAPAGNIVDQHGLEKPY
jgi:uncharacterized protein YkwD